MDVSLQSLGLLVGWLMIGWIAVQGVTLGVTTQIRRGHREREHAGRRAEFCQRIEATARAARAAKAIPDWEGWRQFRVSAIIDEARDVKSFYLSPVDGRPLLPFAPGQYLTFRLPLPGAAPLVRCYSLSTRPREDYFRCTIKRIAAPPDRAGLAPGRGSSFFHDFVQVGDTLDVRAPAGTFHVDPHSPEPMVLVGGGIGITPLVSMLDAVVHTGKRPDIYAIFGFRNGREQPFREALQKLAQECPHVRLHVSYSAPLADDVWYRDYNHRGRVTMERIREALPSNNFRFYVCGPSQMMESLVPALWQWGVPESHVHYEAFGPASVRRASKVDVPRCEVRFVRSNRNAIWDGSFASLLELGEAAGADLPSGCRAGSCGECLTAIRSGAVMPLKQAGVTVPDGHCLTCISMPAGELVLDA